VDLAEFARRLRELAPVSENFRPFVCDGDPFRYKAFVVGFNPASDIPFWEFWSDERGFDKNGWRRTYHAHRRERGKPEAGATRRRLDVIAEAAAPVGILETNLYTTATRNVARLGKGMPDPTVFRLLFDAIRPAAVLFHGRDVQLAVEHIYGVALTASFERRSFRDSGTVLAAAVDHLSRVSFDEAGMLGRLLSDAADPVAATRLAGRAGQLRP